jgi:hypothetical protein
MLGALERLAEVNMVNHRAGALWNLPSSTRASSSAWSGSASGQHPTSRDAVAVELQGERIGCAW